MKRLINLKDLSELKLPLSPYDFENCKGVPYDAVFCTISPTKSSLSNHFLTKFKLKILTLEKSSKTSQNYHQNALAVQNFKGEKPFTSKRNLTFNLLDPDQIRLTLCYTDYFPIIFFCPVISLQFQITMLRSLRSLRFVLFNLRSIQSQVYSIIYNHTYNYTYNYAYNYIYYYTYNYSYNYAYNYIYNYYAYI